MLKKVFELFKQNMKPCLIIGAAVIVTAVSFFKTEYVEHVARAFILLIAGV